jgi:hypothetical protein
MDDIIESSDPISRTIAGTDLMGEVQPLSEEAMPDVSSKTISTSGSATTEAFLVANWLVGVGEG